MFYQDQLGINSTELLTLFDEQLKENGYSKGDDPCFIQSFYLEHLQEFVTMTDLPKIYLMRASNMDGVNYTDPNFDWNTWNKSRF